MVYQFKVFLKTEDLNSWLKKEYLENEFELDIENIQIFVNNEGEPTYIVSWDEDFSDEEE